MPKPTKRDDFDRRLERAIATLPPEVQRLLDTVAIIVEDEPPAAILREMGLRQAKGTSDLCGLHWGVPISRRSPVEAQPFPDQIFIFRGPIARLCGQNRRELDQQILVTLLHEVGHHFGLDEDRLHELGYG